MQLSNEVVSKLQTLISVARLAGIDAFIVSQEISRGIDAGKQVLIFNEESINLPFENIALNRLDVLSSRLELVGDKPDFAVEAESDGDYARALTIKAKGTKMEYRCANPAVVRAPKQIADTMSFSVGFNNDTVDLISKAHAAMKMKNDIIELNSGGESTTLTMEDNDKDTFSFEITGTTSTLKGGKGDKFSRKYPAKILLSMLKKNPEQAVEIGANGLMKLQVCGITVYILPQV